VEVQSVKGFGFPVYDADNHLYETRDALTRHLDKKHHRNVQYVEVGGRTKLAICGKISDYIPNPTFEVVVPPGSYSEFMSTKGEGKTMRELGRAAGPIPCPDEFRDRDKRLALMDEQGLHGTILWGTLVSAIEERMKHDAELMHAVLRSFNRWLLEEWGFVYRDRLFAVPMLSLMDIDLACEELEWCLEHGARIVGIRPAPVPGYRASRSPALPEFDPFWARVAEAGITVGMHASDSGYDRYGADWEGGMEFLPFEMTPLRRSLSASPIHDTVAAFICHGLFKRHSGLRIVSVENGSGWVPGLLRRLESVVTDQDPREMFRRHIWVALGHGETPERIAEEIGVDQMLFGSDFPHPEGLGQPLEYYEDVASLGSDNARKIMGSNLEGLLELRPASAR
jgi:predicted TIM-barrel fold metal-dependent hydrolase